MERCRFSPKPDGPLSIRSRLIASGVITGAVIGAKEIARGMKESSQNIGDSLEKSSAATCQAVTAASNNIGNSIQALPHDVDVSAHWDRCYQELTGKLAVKKLKPGAHGVGVLSGCNDKHAHTSYMDLHCAHACRGTPVAPFLSEAHVMATSIRFDCTDRSHSIAQHSTQ